MKFNSTKNLRLVNIRNFTSKAGNPCTFLTLADPQTYESADFMPLKGLDLSAFSVGNDYDVILHYDGRYTNVELLPPAK